jgi:hypothetical protein
MVWSGGSFGGVVVVGGGVCVNGWFNVTSPLKAGGRRGVSLVRCVRMVEGADKSLETRCPGDAVKKRIYVNIHI